MKAQTRVNPWWVMLTVWAVVNAVNVLQTAGFLSRVVTGNLGLNHALGFGMMALAIPAAVALIVFVRAGAGWQQALGPAIFLAFVALMSVVDYLWPVEFRSPPRPSILAPYLTLFFGSILLMGVPMFRMDRRLWLVTVVTTVLLLGAMILAMARGVG